MKICPHCKQNLDESLFNKHKNRKDGLSVWCKICMQEYDKEYQIKNKEKIKIKRQKYYKDNKKFLQEEHKKYNSNHKKESQKRNKKNYQKDKEKN